VAVLLIAMPTMWVSAGYLERGTLESANPKPDHPDPEHVESISRIGQKDDMATNLPQVEAPIGTLGKVTNWPAPERMDVVLEPNLALSLTVYMDSQWTRGENYVVRDFFKPGEKVYWLIGIQNDTGGSVLITGTWDIDYPDGSPVFDSNPTWTVPAGHSVWHYNGVANSVGGMYTFFAAVDYHGDHSEDTRNYWVLPFDCYLPIVQN
jgi:hypothetical protein